MTSQELDSFFLLVIQALIIVSITILLWRKIWSRLSIIMLPRSLASLRTIDIRNSIEHKARKPIHEMCALLWEWSPHYFIKFCGLDGYSYIAFLRTGVKISYTIAFFSLLTIVFFQYTFNINNIVFAITTETENWIYMAQLITTSVIVFIIMSHLYFLKQELREGARLKIDNEGDPNIEISKLYTVKVTTKYDQIDTNGEVSLGASGVLEVQEIPFIDGLENLLELRECNYQLGCIEKAKMKKKTFFCIRLGKKEEKLKKRVAELVQLIDDNKKVVVEPITKPKSFVCFSSQKDLCNFGKSYLNPKKDTGIVLWCKKLWAVLKRNKGQMGPNIQDILFHSDNIINYKRFPEPTEIIWKNFVVDSKGRRVRKCLVNMLIMVIFIFLTTPASLISILDSGFLTVSGDSKKIESGSLTDQIIKIFSSVLVITINALLLLLIDYSVYMEKLQKMSSLQKAIYDKAIIYLLLNNFLVPCLVQTSGSIYLILKNESNISHLFLQVVLLKDSRVFYTSLILQSGIFSFAFVLLRIPELFSSLGNPLLAHFKRLDIIKFPWTRQEVDAFQYGYYYANTVTMTIICLIFSSSLPFLAISLLTFYLLRLFSDSYVILTNHRVESESLGELVTKGISGLCFGCIVLQVITMSNLIYYQRLEAVGVFIILLICLPFYQSLSRNDLFDYPNITFDPANENNCLYQWSFLYRHPVNLSNRCSIALPIR